MVVRMEWTCDPPLNLWYKTGTMIFPSIFLHSCIFVILFRNTATNSDFKISSCEKFHCNHFSGFHSLKKRKLFISILDLTEIYFYHSPLFPLKLWYTLLDFIMLQPWHPSGRSSFLIMWLSNSFYRMHLGSKEQLRCNDTPRHPEVII